MRKLRGERIRAEQIKREKEAAHKAYLADIASTTTTPSPPLTVRRDYGVFDIPPSGWLFIILIDFAMIVISIIIISVMAKILYSLNISYFSGYRMFRNPPGSVASRADRDDRQPLAENEEPVGAGGIPGIDDSDEEDYNRNNDTDSTMDEVDLNDDDEGTGSAPVVPTASPTTVTTTTVSSTSTTTPTTYPPALITTMAIVGPNGRSPVSGLHLPTLGQMVRRARRESPILEPVVEWVRMSPKFHHQRHRQQIHRLLKRQKRLGGYGEVEEEEDGDQDASVARILKAA